MWDIKIAKMIFEKRAENLYFKDGTYYQLFAHGITDNGCWLINPQMIEVDVDIKTGRYVHHEHSIIHLGNGSIQTGPKFIYKR